LIPPAPSSGLSGELTIDLSAISRNWQALDRVSGRTLTGAVIKADAYGTGLVAAALTLAATGAQFFFVATPDEAIALRATLPNAHVFVLDGVYPGAGALYASERLMPVISSLAMLEEWLHLCVTRNEALPAALHFDTGMNRLGFALRDTSVVKRKIGDLGFAPQMIMSHLACADVPNHDKNRTQLALFRSLMHEFPGVPGSLANSAGMMTSRDNHFQLVRPGVAIFGGRAVMGRANPMVPVVKLELPILQIRDAHTGESVGYGATYTLSRDSRLAIVGGGYADGLFRSLAGTNSKPGGLASVRGRLVPIVGRVSMDLIALDVTELGTETPLPGEMAELLGDQVSVDMQADAAGTIGYEVLTALKGRYRRRYVNPPAGVNL
jgi:alanine racemase